MPDLKLNNTNPYSNGYIVELEDGKSLLKREKLTYDPIVNRDSSYTIREEDTLWGLAYRYYGNSKLWYIIADVNSIEHPLVLQTGLQITIPDLDVLKISKDAT